MNFKPQNYFLFLCVVFYFIFYAGLEARAQLAKEAAAIEQQNYTVTENDMRSYQIIHESVNKKDYAAYSQVLREKIKQSLSKNYTYQRKEGDVDISFILNFDGSLAKLDVDSADSANDKELVNIATKSVRQASPFPHFPKTLPLSRMSFNVKISFKAG